MPPHRQVAAELPLPGLPVHGPQRFSIHQQDALVTIGDRGEKTLSHHRQTALLGDEFQQGPQTRCLRRDAHHPEARTPPQGLEHHLTLLLGEGFQFRDASRHQGGSHPTAEAQGAQLLVPTAQRRRAIEHQGSGTLRHLQQVRGVEVRLINGRVLAHPDRIKAVELLALGGPEREPGLRLNRHGNGERLVSKSDQIRRR